MGCLLSAQVVYNEIGFPLTLVLGLVIVWIGMNDILAQYQVFATQALQFLREMAGSR